ncbi:hypothetical protein H4582DRAFT_2105076 [Lactarius indigo]|nr:hypothetical protein H4582DRAFT_2105076 [Lactarius indigo]
MLVLPSPASPAHPPGVTSRALASTSTTLYPLRPHLPLRRWLLIVPVLSAQSRIWAGKVVLFDQAVSGAGRVIPLGEDDGLHTWLAPEYLVIGEGSKIWVQARVLGGMLVAGKSACVELQVKNHSAKSRYPHLPAPAQGSGKKVPPLLQIPESLASISFRGPEYTANPGTKGIAQLVFDVPRSACTVSAHPRHGGDVDEGEGEGIAVKKKIPPLFEEIVLELPVAIFHPATLPPNIPLSGSRCIFGPIFEPESLLIAITAPPYPDADALRGTRAVSALRVSHDPFSRTTITLWFPPLPGYIGSPSYEQPQPHRPTNAHASTIMAAIPPSGLPISGTPDHMLSSISHQQEQQRHPSQQTIGHGSLSARISHHLRATSRARSVSLPPARSVTPPPTQVEVEVLAPKPIPSPKLVSETLDVDRFAPSFGRVGTCTRSLSVVKLEEMAVQAAAEMEAKAVADKTLPTPPVPFGKLLGYSESMRPVAQDIFEKEQASAEPEMLVFTERGRETEDNVLDALEQRLVEQVGTRKYPPAPVVMADPPPTPVPVPVPTPGKRQGKVAAAEELEHADEVVGGGAGVNESAISSLVLGAEEDFCGRNANASDNVLVGLEQQEGDALKGAGASSGSERGTHKARSRKSVKSDSKDREKMKKERELEKLAPPEAERELVVADAVVENEDTRSPTFPQEQAPASSPNPAPDPTVTADPSPAPAQEPLAVIESNPNLRSSGFISVTTLRRAPITLPAPESAPTAQSNVPPTARRVANKFPPPPQVEMKYDVKSVRSGQVTAVASIWAEATKTGGARAPTPVEKGTKATGNPTQLKAAAHKSDNNNRNLVSTPTPLKPMTSIVAPGARVPDGRVPLRLGKPAAFATPASTKAEKVEKEGAPPAAARVPRALIRLGVAAAAMPSSPALSSSIATPVLLSTSSLAQPPGARACASVRLPTPPPAIAASPSPQPATAGWHPPFVSGVGLKADLALGQALLCDLIRQYQGQAA